MHVRFLREIKTKLQVWTAQKGVEKQIIFHF